MWNYSKTSTHKFIFQIENTNTKIISSRPKVFVINFFQVFKRFFFIKSNIRLKTVFNSIKILKRYCNPTLYVLYNKNIK